MFILKNLRQLNTNKNTCDKTLSKPILISILRKVHDKIDYSSYPVLNENDLEESFINGSGPGGQNVNKRQNCVFLKHKPTNISVKCHQFRELSFNRKKARELLLTRLDNHFNGDSSIEAQKTRIVLEKIKLKEEKAKLLREQKIKYKQLVSKENNVNDEN